MITYRKIDRSEKQELMDLIDTVLEGLERKEFFIPFSEEELEAMFDESKAVTYGAYDDGKLIGMAQFSFGGEFVDGIKAMLGMEDALAGEFSGVLVLKEYRGNGIMKQLFRILIGEAEARNYDCLVAIAHPENTASNKGVLSTGAKLMKTGFFGEYFRNVYLLPLKERIAD